MARFVLSVVFLLALACAAPSLAMSIGEAAAVSDGTRDGAAVRPSDLAAVRRLIREAVPEADVSRLVEAVLGEGSDIAARDAAAYRLLALGYSARDTADVVSGRIGRHALDTARRMIAVGRARDEVARYLEAAYGPGVAVPHAPLVRPHLAAPVLPSARPRVPAPTAPAGPFDAAIAHYARLHQIEVAIVRAIIEIESAFDPLARSPKGAIGLMQLMPGTARALGVNPFVPEQNIEGGVRYFSQMLEMFGGIELALAAYNAGPGTAERYVRGLATLPGETRAYVRNVLARLGASN
jgi:hypothetical protein